MGLVQNVGGSRRLRRLIELQRCRQVAKIEDVAQSTEQRQRVVYAGRHWPKLCSLRALQPQALLLGRVPEGGLAVAQERVCPAMSEGIGGSGCPDDDGGRCTGTGGRRA